MPCDTAKTQPKVTALSASQPRGSGQPDILGGPSCALWSGVGASGPLWAGGGWGVDLWRILSQNRWGSEADQTAVHTHLPGRPGGGPPGPSGMEHRPPPNLCPGLCWAHPGPEMGAHFCASGPPFSRATSPACRECPGEQQKPRGAPRPHQAPRPENRQLSGALPQGWVRPFRSSVSPCGLP